jgi:hypothetical protein
MKKKTNIEEWVSTNGLANPSHPLTDETLDQAFKMVTGFPDIAGGEKTVLGEHRRLLAEKIPDVVKGLYPKE